MVLFLLVHQMGLQILDRHDFRLAQIFLWVQKLQSVQMVLMGLEGQLDQTLLLGHLGQGAQIVLFFQMGHWVQMVLKDLLVLVVLCLPYLLQIQTDLVLLCRQYHQLSLLAQVAQLDQVDRYGQMGLLFLLALMDHFPQFDLVNLYVLRVQKYL